MKMLAPANGVIAVSRQPSVAWRLSHETRSLLDWLTTRRSAAGYGLAYHFGSHRNPLVEGAQLIETQVMATAPHLIARPSSILLVVLSLDRAEPSLEGLSTIGRKHTASGELVRPSARVLDDVAREASPNPVRRVAPVGEWKALGLIYAQICRPSRRKPCMHMDWANRVCADAATTDCLT